MVLRCCCPRMSKGGAGSWDAIRTIWKLARACSHYGFRSEQVMMKTALCHRSHGWQFTVFMSMTNQVEWMPIASPFAKSQSSKNYHQLSGEQRCFQFFLFVFRLVYLCVCDGVCMWACMYAGQRTTCESPFSPPTVWIPRIQLTSQVWWQPSLLTESPPSTLLVFKMFAGGLERRINC